MKLAGFRGNSGGEKGGRKGGSSSEGFGGVA